MATTTNYGWETPDDTDLVKDGAAAVRTLGSSADTTVKNLNPGTTAGDIDYYTSGTAKARIGIGTANQVLQVNSGATAPEWGVDPVADVVTTAGDLLYATAADTVTRLGIGTAGQILTVNSGATAPEWAAAAGGGSGLTLVTSQALSAATININNCFSGTYENYVLVLNVTNMSLGANIRYRLRVSGSDATTNYGSQMVQTYGASTINAGESVVTDYWQFGNADPAQCFQIAEIARPYSADQTWAISHTITGLSGTYNDMLSEWYGAINKNSTSYDGITIYSHNGATITGTARIYGRANS